MTLRFGDGWWIELPEGWEVTVSAGPRQVSDLVTAHRGDVKIDIHLPVQTKLRVE